MITTGGTNSPAIAALLQGGAGGPYNAIFGVSNAGSAGNGGGTGDLAITLTGTPSAPIQLTTTGGASPGVVAITAGGPGGTGGDLNSTLGGGVAESGGNGGAGGNIAVKITATSIQTSGDNSSGIFARSVGALGATVARPTVSLPAQEVREAPAARPGT